MYTLTVVSAALLCATAFSASVSVEMSSFESWAAQHNKVYAEDVVAQREIIFNKNMETITEHNIRYEQGLETYTMGPNQFTDLTHEEFKQLVSNPLKRTTPRNEVSLLDGSTQVPATVDWRVKGAVTPVKNQGQCGSCWAFSTTGSTEGAWQIAGNKLVSLSEQQLMDCSVPEGDHSCQGGLMDYAFKYIKENGGIDSEADYPYQMKNEPCLTAKEEKKVAHINGYNDVPKTDAELVAAIAKGPVSVAIEADQQGFQHYAAGIFSGPCGQQLDHGVLAVGYSKEYYIVKNSWGAAWGDKGYIHMARNVQAPVGICGILTSASYPIIGANQTSM